MREEQDARIGDWLPSPYDVDARQHRLVSITSEFGLMSVCGHVLVTYRENDPRVPWTSWPKCTEWQAPDPLASSGARDRGNGRELRCHGAPGRSSSE